MSSVQDIPLPVSVATADDLSTARARTANGRVVSTTGRKVPGDNGAASYIYRRTGRSGVTTDNGAFLSGPGVDDYWEVTRKDVLNFAIYGADNTGATNVRIYLQAADNVPGETLLIPEGTYLISNDITFTRRVQFEFGAKFKIDNGATVTLSNGYVATDTQHVFDISLGGEVEVDNMAKVSVAHWGAVPDYVYPSTGTDSSPAIQATFDAAENIAATKTWREPKRPEVFIPPGSYRLNTGVALLNKPNLYAAGATFVYLGSQASDGAILTIGAFTGTPGEEIELGTFFLPSVTGVMTRTQILESEEEFVGIRIDACGSSVFHCELTNFVSIGLQLRPNSKSYVAHNHFLNHKAWAVKTAQDFQWRWDQDEPGNFGWSNENVFTNCNWTQDSASRWFGTSIGCRMRCTNARPDLPAWDFGGSNNNRFFGQCYQPATEFVGGARLTVGDTVVSNPPGRYWNPANGQDYLCSVGGVVATLPTNTDFGLSPADANGVRFTHQGPHNGNRLQVGVYVVQGNRYFNPSTRQEYICTVAGLVATVPTNVAYDLSSADANGVRFKHRGPYFHAPVFLDKNGGFNLWHGTRWEYGDGAFCYIANSALYDGNISRSNEIVVYDYARQNSYRGGMVLIDDYTLARKNAYAGMRNIARVYGQELSSKHVINDIHKRVVVSDTGICVRGMQWFNYGTNQVAEYANYGFEHWRFLKESFYEVTSQLLGVIVDLTKSPRVGAMKLSYAPEPPVTLFGSPSVPGGTSAVPLDNENNMVVVSNGTATDFISNGQRANNIWTIGGEPLYCSAGSNANVKRVFLGTGGGNGSISTHLELHNVPGGTVENAILSVVTPDIGRFSVGTPTGGYFLERNEFIRHHTTEAFSSSGWRVRTPGILARPWAAGVDVEATELRMHGGNVYAALSSGETGVTAPTGTGSSVSDGLRDWEYIGPQAELEEVFEGAALAVGSPPTNGNLTLRSDGSSGNWYRANSYVSTKTLSGDFDISFKVVGIGQSHMIGVTALTQPTDFNNFQNFEFGVLWFGGTTVTISQLAVQKNHTIAGWGNYMVRLVRTGSTLDCYINDVLLALETAMFTANATTNVLTSAGHGLADGRPVRFEGADLPGGIVEGDVYYVRDSTTDTFKIALTLGGAAVDLLDAGSGTQTFFANAIITDDLHVMYSAYDTEDSEAIIYNDDYKPTYQGAAIVATIEPVQGTDEAEVLPSTATPTFRWTIFPGRFKSMILTANVSGMTFMADEAGVYTIAFTQNATGGWTVTWPAGINGVAPDLNLLGGSTTIFTLYYTGSEWHWQDPTPSSRVNVSLVSDGDGADWDLSNTYVSNDTLSGDFDITFEVVDRQQLYMVGVTTDNVPTSLNNYLNFEYGVYWLSSTSVQVWQNGTSANHTIATWGNGLVRLVRTGTNIDLYINGTLVAAATNASFTASNVRRMYSANANVLSEAILYGDLNTPIAVGSNLTQTNTDLPDENGVETVTFSATATFNFAVDPRKHKRMTLTANATGLVVIITEPGIYYIALTQDSTPRTVTFATTIKGTQPTMATGSGEKTLFTIYSNGTDLFWM